MKEYVTFTLEEIRCADYMANPKLWANGATGSFGAAPNQTSPAKRAKQDFGEIFNEQLKCYICESFPKAGKHYWYRCMQGHMVCHECKEARKPSFFKFGASSNQTVCSCQKPFMPDHCKLIESLLNARKMEFKCENLTRGCQETSGKENMIFHQDECIFRVVKCPRIFCKSKVPFHELLEHMEQNGDHSKHAYERLGEKLRTCSTNGKLTDAWTFPRKFKFTIFMTKKIHEKC